MGARDGASRTGDDPAPIDVPAIVLAIGAAESTARHGVVTVDVAAVAARRRAVVDAMTPQRTSVSTHAAAMDHVVAVEVASIAVGTPLVAVAAAVTLALRSTQAASVPGMAATRDHQRRDGEQETVSSLHDRPW